MYETLNDRLPPSYAVTSECYDCQRPITLDQKRMYGICDHCRKLRLMQECDGTKGKEAEVKGLD